MDGNLLPQIQDFDNQHLDRLYRLIFDRWNWDTGNEADKQFLEQIESVMNERGIGVPDMGGNVSLSGRNVNGKEEFHIQADKIVMEPRCGPVTDLFEYDSMGNLILGYELQQALVRYLNGELRFGSTWVDGNNMKQSVQHAVREDLEWRFQQLEQKLDDSDG